MLLYSFFEGLNHNCFGMGQNPLAWIIAKVRIQKVTYKIASIKLVRE